MLDLAVAHGERWGALATGELIRRHEQELAWLAELAELAARTGAAAVAGRGRGAAGDRPGRSGDRAGRAVALGSVRMAPTRRSADQPAAAQALTRTGAAAAGPGWAATQTPLFRHLLGSGSPDRSVSGWSRAAVPRTQARTEGGGRPARAVGLVLRSRADRRPGRRAVGASRPLAPDAGGPDGCGDPGRRRGLGGSPLGLAPPGLAALLGHVRGRIGDRVRVRAEVLQVLGHPQQVRVMRSRDHADQVRAVALLQPVSRRPGCSSSTPLSSAAEGVGPLPFPFRPVNAGTTTGSSTWPAIGRPTSIATRS